jgi:hypothetical protein
MVNDIPARGPKYPPNPAKLATAKRLPKSQRGPKYPPNPAKAAIAAARANAVKKV